MTEVYDGRGLCHEQADTMETLCKRVQDLEQQRNKLETHEFIYGQQLTVRRAELDAALAEHDKLRTERDEARQWARKLLWYYELASVRFASTGWVTVRVATIAALTATRDALQAENAALAERDEARQWARNLLWRCDLEHWILMRAASWQRDDEATIAALTAERDALQNRLDATGEV